MSRKGWEEYSKAYSDYFDFEDMNGLTIDEMCEELQKIKKGFIGKKVGNIIVENITLKCEHRDCTPEWVLWGIDQEKKKRKISQAMELLENEGYICFRERSKL